MQNKNYEVAFEVTQSAEEVFNAIASVTKWWTENMQGQCREVNDEFTVQFEDIHFSKQKLTEVVPNKSIVWLITESHLSFLRDKQEWTGTEVRFEISGKGSKTQLRFTHVGLVPDVECYKDCSNAWSYYIATSLRQLITTGKGIPEKLEAHKQ
ncbi:MAG: SRPBCC domain-containing protein [Bacteroidia bacterium]|nr:SRPBCC domain-containing protein [Bacteroidia bacterium]